MRASDGLVGVRSSPGDGLVGGRTSPADGRHPSCRAVAWVSRFVAVAIAVVVGLHFGPRPGPHVAASPVATSIVSTASVDSLKVGERLEPRIPPAPLLDRSPPAPSSRSLEAPATPPGQLAIGASALGSRSFGEPIPIVKHVPRLERGDPPRV